MKEDEVADILAHKRELQAEISDMKSRLRTIANLCNAPHWTAARRLKIYSIATGSDRFCAPIRKAAATGMAGTIEAARVLTRFGPFDKSIMFAGLAGEEQGLFGGQGLAARAKAEDWRIEAVLNNDMIGNIAGIDQVVDNTVFRVFSEPRPPATTEAEWRAIRFYGGEVDGPSRQVARYVERITSEYFRNLDAMMFYRLDRFGRGGHHRPFNDAGYPGVRIMETHEHYDRQHQNLRTENGIAYGDVIEGVNFPYAARLTGVNAVTMAALASAPPPPSATWVRSCFPAW